MGDSGQESNTKISFEKEISRFPKEIQDNLKSAEKKFLPIIDLIKEKVSDKIIGLYISTEIEVTDNVPKPNFEKLTLNFLFDDFEKPIQFFDPKLLFGEKFEEVLTEKKLRDEHGQEYTDYFIKGEENLRFFGTSISILRENCFDGIYDDLKRIGTSLIYHDARGFVSALKTIDIHRNMLLQKFEKYVVVYAGAGSWLRGEKSNDFDVFIVIDDTDVKRMPRLQVKDQLTKIIWQMSREVASLTGIQIHIQVYLLTDFWDALKDAHPVMFTFLRDGVPFYDRGLYSAWKELLKLGKIRPSPEAIDMHMNVGTQLIERSKKMFNDIFMNEVHYAVLNPSQALLMLKGYNPTTPKETIKIFKEVLLKKEKSISEYDVKTLEESVKLWKDLEHNKDKELSGKDLDERIIRADKFLANVKKIFEEISMDRTKSSVLSSHTELLNQIRTLPGLGEIEDKKLIGKFESDYLVKGRFPSFVKDSIKGIQKAREDYDKGVITVTEVNKVLKEIRNIISEINSYRDSNLLNEVDKKKLFVKYGENQTAEVLSFDGLVYLIDNQQNKIYEFKDKQFVLSKVSRDIFSDTSKIDSLELDSKMFDSLKKTLDSKEIFL